IVLTALLICGSAVASATRGEPPQTASTPNALMERYCITCHTQNSKDKGLVPVALDKLDLSDLTKDAEIWENVVRKVGAGVMPPAGAPRPSPAESSNLVQWITTELDRAAEKSPNPGR